LRQRIFLSLTIIIGVFAAGFFCYGEINPGHEPAVLGYSSGSEQPESIFPDPSRTSYNMKLYLNPGQGMLFGQTQLDTVNTSPQALEELWFTAYPNAFKDQVHSPAPASAYYDGFNPGWMKVTALTVNGVKASWEEQGVSLLVKLPAEIKPLNTLKILIQWEIKIPRVAYRYGSKHSVYMLGNFYPALNLLAADGWHNSYNSVFGDPFCFPCADYEVEVNIPQGYELVSTGLTQEVWAEDNGREIHKVKAANARDFCMAVVYDYSQVQNSIHHTSLRCYAPSGDINNANQVLDMSRDIFNYYACTFGSYPYKEFKIVFVPMQGFHGMEYSGVIFVRDEFLRSPVDNEFLLAHEIAHQWWYSVVGNDQVQEPWLDEGLANWSAYKYLQDCKGQKPPSEAQFKRGVKLTRELKEIYSSQEYYRTAYTGGEQFWFGLENELGSDQVIKVLRKYYADFRYGIATTQDLKECIRAEAHKDMDDYFKLWFD
jgi:hypothetical protein